MEKNKEQDNHFDVLQPSVIRVVAFGNLAPFIHSVNQTNVVPGEVYLNHSIVLPVDTPG
ncbi:hypothetical protein [Ureibacillus sinduriensis]|uniref:hypothetical protein n=1 Tax=Ureibacillus sinduriensis TaxID=561440 RepID=UPI000AD9274A|nr:hypothetical protein [Ureibacillus sinduriensis]